MMRTRDKGYPVGRGALLIINQGTFTSPDLTCREPGTNVDRDNLELVFRSLGYGVHIANNCNGDAFEEHLENAVDLIGDGVGPFVLAFLSHGGSGDCLYFADGTHMSMSAIRRALQGHRTLDGRPKIIIVQACRGPEHLVVLKDGSTEIRIEGEDFSPDSVIADPMADTIIMWSCMEERDLKCREPGTSKDRDSLELVFRSLGYGVHIANDCNKDAFEGHLENAVDLIGDGVGPFVLAFLSHGDSGVVVLKDGSTEIRIEGEDFSPDSVIADPMADTIIMWSCSMFITLTCDEILKNMSLAKRTPPSGEKHIPDLSMSVHKNMERYGTKCHGFRMLTSPENISSLKKPLFLGPPVDEDKFRRAVGRINQLRLKLSRATGQVVSNLQADDAQKGKCREQS
ncbi:hypothetical protein FOCC_FOCC001072 [Frankliniella occidentalis]|nr:hypothetical protein FOCC_FOCC001072 [Frankliniella occidentalis]